MIFDKSKIYEDIKKISKVVEEKGVEEAVKEMDKTPSLSNVTQNKQSNNANTTPNNSVSSFQYSNINKQRLMSNELINRRKEYLQSDRYAEALAKREKERIANELKQKRYELENKYKEIKDWQNSVGGQGKYLDPDNWNKKEEEAKSIKTEIELINDNLLEYDNPSALKKALLTPVEAGSRVIQGALSLPEGIADLGTHVIAQVEDFKGNEEYADKLRKSAQKNVVSDKLFGKSNKYFDKNSYSNDTWDSIFQGVGYSFPIGIISTTLPGVGKVMSDVLLGASAMGSTLNEAYSNENISDKKAWTKAASSAALEVGVENLFGVLGYGGSSIEDAIMNSTNKIKNGLVKAIAQTGISMTGEGTEELLSYAGNYLIDHGLDFVDKSSKIGQEWDNEELWKSFFVGAMSAGIAQAPVNLINYKATQKANNNNISQTDINDNQNDLNNVLEENKETSNSELQMAQNNKNAQTILSNITTNVGENALPSINENRYQYQASDNIKVNNFRKDASQYLNNSVEAQKWINTMEQIIKDKNIDIRLDGNLKTNDGKIANGSYSNGTITINPNSNRAGEFIAIHELTHAIGTKPMLNIIDTYRKSNADFDMNVQELLKNYNATEINEETLADVSAQLFGTQEFINNVANTQPTLFKRIYNEIKYLWHQFKGYKNQNQFINDLYFKWTQAYNSNNKLNNTTNYYIETVANYDEMEYNNAKEVKLSRREYAILSGIINSDSNIKPGINEVETTNAQYTVYFKETGEFKVLDKIINEEDDINVLRRTLSRDEATGSEQFNKQMDSQKISNERTGTRNDGILEVDSSRTYKRSGSNYYGETNSRNNIKYSIQESENNSGSFNLTKKDNKGRTLSQEQQEYFKNSKVRDEDGNLKTLYHGTQRADRVGNYFNPEKATSGPMAFFTDSEQIATNYSNDKTDTSLSREYDTEKDLFKIDGKNLEEYWTTLSNKEKQKINENGKYVGFDEDWENIVFDKNNDSFTGQYDYYLKNETQNNGIEALYKTFIEDGNLYGEDISKFKQVLELAGLDNIEYLDPYKIDKKVYEVYLNIKTPFDTSDISNDIVKQLETASKRATIGEQYSADMWDKSNITPEAWMERLNDDIKNDTTHAWTVIPDWVTNVLKRNGYDGIIDTGGKNGGQEHQVIVPFYSEQIKNVDNTTPTNNPDIRYSTTNSNSWQKYLEKNFTTKGTRTNLQDILVQKAENKVSESKSEINNSSNNKLSKADEVQTALKSEQHIDEASSTSNKGKETESSTSSNANKQHSITTKDSRYISRNSNKFINKLVENLQISKYSNKETLRNTVQEIRDEVLNNGKLTNEKRKEIFDKMYSDLVVEDKLYYEEYKELLKDINSTRFIVPDSVKANIPDYSEWSKKNLNNLVPKKGLASINIDTKYKELSEAYPNLFDSNITSPSDQLKKIVEIKNDISKARVNLQAYNDKNLGSEYKTWAEKDFNTLVDTLEQDILTAKRYRDEKNKELEEKKLLSKEIKTIEEIKDIFALKKSYQKEYNKVLNKEVLTKNDLNIVQSLLENKITVDAISQNTNQKGILNVYNAKKPLYEIDKAIKNYQKKVKESRYNEVENLIQNIDDWKDKKTFGGFRYSRETAQRNIRDVVGDNEIAAKINRELFDKYSKNETNAIKEKNELVQRIKDIGFDTSKKYIYGHNKIDEATLAQLYVEKKLNDTDLKLLDVDVNKIKRGAKEYQNILDNLINRMSDELVKNGYAPVEYRKDYFPHFTENKPDTAISKIASLVGIDMTNQDLPTDIAGITETFKPGKTWMGNLLQRTGDKTEYNAYKALDKYISGAMDIIYHTSDIQRLRAFENTVRNNYASESLKEAVENVKDNDILTEQEKEEQIEIIYNREKTQLSNFVTWLREYTDGVANKKASGDRAWEKGVGRNIYNTMNNIEGKIASNMIGGNLSVSLTNIAPIFQATAETGYGDLVIGMMQTMKSNIKNDGFDSDFLTRRKGADRLSKTFTESISDFSGKPMQIIDDFVSESIVRAKYRQNLNNGMNAIEAIENADTYAAELMADRSKGALPTIFNKKNPVAKLINMFQVEVNNTVSNYTKDMPRNSAGALQLTKAYTKLAVGSAVFNTFMKSIRGGGDVLPDPISWIKNLVLWAIGEDDEKEKAKDDLLDGLIGSLPFIQSTAGLLGMEDVGRVPISSAMPDITKIFGLSGVDEKYKKQVLTKELTKPLIYLGLPTGGAQIKKTVEGLLTLSNGGSYKYNKEGEKYLQYAVEDKSAKKIVQSAIFGKWSTSEAKEYVNDGMKALSPKETKIYDNSTIPFKEFKKYTNATLNKKSDKTNFIDKMDLNTSQRWDMYTGFVFSDTKREKDGSSQLKDAEYAVKNGIKKDEYIKAYNNALINDVNMPEKEDLEEITKNKVDINNYITFKINTKGMEKNKEKLQELKSANYSEEDKKFIYQKINSQDSNYELLMNIGVKIDDYLDYKMQEFESDKTDDGTLNGKTVQNSRKKKILNYINNSNLPYEQRLLLYGMNLSLSSDEKTKLFNYVNTSNLSKDDKMKLLNKVNGFTVYKNGKVEW